MGDGFNFAQLPGFSAFTQETKIAVEAAKRLFPAQTELEQELGKIVELHPSVDFRPPTVQKRERRRKELTLAIAKLDKDYAAAKYKLYAEETALKATAQADSNFLALQMAHDAKLKAENPEEFNRQKRQKVAERQWERNMLSAAREREYAEYNAQYGDGAEYDDEQNYDEAPPVDAVD
eukprot:CAMPEP_0202941856 /NCGR_PEP_ID=MMETSP1395-20130829/1994_1 /ASSEMBLY_ACC=CAM_ASM_000871 /TAXON_ID=5961 /ORGANISM="Blepharisma japonicum, Strain Stock R1072" /LENGTH=177 /DNA_ID=CAMNT_0049637477 /DNA_START=36 /DNA_END=569 /DNA_ORIENTATION=+